MTIFIRGRERSRGGRSSLAAQSAQNRQNPPIYRRGKSRQSQCRKNNFRSPSPPVARFVRLANFSLPLIVVTALACNIRSDATLIEMKLVTHSATVSKNIASRASFSLPFR